MFAKDLTQQQLTNFTIIERLCSTLSLVGCAFIAISYLALRDFRNKPINRLVFYASLGNIFTNVATLISRSSTILPNGGLCQFQAFLIQMFMPADAYWTLAMACNVYLTFYWKFDGERLRKLEIFYVVLCYGVPFIPAFVYIFTKTAEKGRMYGNATLWCWISNEWDVFRIFSFYGPVWIVILITMAIYLRAGREIYAKRKSLSNFSGPAPEPLPLIGDPFQSIKTTEVFVTSEAVNPSSEESIVLVEYPRPPPAAKSAYTVTVTTTNAVFEHPTQERVSSRLSYAEKGVERNNIEASHPSDSERDELPKVPLSAYIPNQERSRLYPMRRHAAQQADTAVWSYTKVSVLFFTAMLVTWIPSSANRLYSVVHTEQVNVGLVYAAAFVLPLQGFWNALIYTTTNLSACKAFWDRILSGKRSSMGGMFSGSEIGTSRENRSNKLYTETDSIDNLTRPGSRGNI